jgi:hypothetical protein
MSSKVQEGSGQCLQGPNSTSQQWGTGSIFGWLTLLWRPSNCRDKWSTCHPYKPPKESNGVGDTDNLAKVISLGE